MKYKLINKIIINLGRTDYQIDERISFYNMYLVVFEKFIQIFRGAFVKLLLHNSNGLLFVGKNVNLKHKNLITFGKSIQIGDNVEINALSKNGVTIGNNVSILRNSIIECTGVIRDLGEGLTIGNNVGIAQNCFIQVRGQVVIGNNVIFGPGVSVFSETHNFSDSNRFINEQGETRKGVIIEDGVWIASNATILDGVTIGRNSIVAAGSVVNTSVPENTIFGGVPAKIIKHRR